MCPGPSRTTKRPPNRTYPPPANESDPRPGPPGETAPVRRQRPARRQPPARRRRPSRRPRSGAVPRHQDPVPTARPRLNGERSRVLPPACLALPPRLLASPASKRPGPAGRFRGPGGLMSPPIHREASRPRAQNARRETPAASPHHRAGRPSASGCGAEDHTGADPATEASGGPFGGSSGRFRSPNNGLPARRRGVTACPASGRDGLPGRRGAKVYPAPGSGGNSPDFS